MKTLNAPGDLNISRVLRLIWQSKGISRIEIAQQLGIDKSTVTKIVSSLEETGVIRAFAHGETGPQGGRKPIHLEVSPCFGLAAGIEITTDGVLAVLVNLTGDILHTTRLSFDTLSVFDAFDQAMHALEEYRERLKTPLIGIGVGLPAIVNAEKGTILKSIPLMIETEQEFASWAQEKYRVPVYLENDARCGCLGEIVHRKGKGLENALFLLSEIRKITGSSGSRKNLSVGFGFLLGGQSYHGRSFSSGEFRSILWEEGNKGQFRTDDIEGDLVGRDIYATGTVFGELAAHTAFLVNLLNLDYVFLGGLPAELTVQLAKMIQAEIERKWPYGKPPECSVIPASLSAEAVAYGAAGLCVMRFFALPNIYHRSGEGPSVMEQLEALSDREPSGNR